MSELEQRLIFSRNDCVINKQQALWGFAKVMKKSCFMIL